MRTYSNVEPLRNPVTADAANLAPPQTVTMDYRLFERLVGALEVVEKWATTNTLQTTLTLEEVAEALHVKTAFVRDLWRNGELKGIHLNRQNLVFRREDVLEYLEYKASEGVYYK